jgi:hypothetical protein
MNCRPASGAIARSGRGGVEGTHNGSVDPLVGEHFHAAARAWALDELTAGRVTVADLKTGLAATRALLPAAFSGLAARQHPGNEAPVDVAALLSDELSALLGDILDRLSPEELGRLPEPVWALLDFIAGPEATEAAL